MGRIVRLFDFYVTGSFIADGVEVNRRLTSWAFSWFIYVVGS